MGGPLTLRRQFPHASRILATVSIVALLLLAGCAGKSKTTASLVGGPQATVTDSTGAIRGALLDGDQLPVAGADVGLQGAGVAAVQSDDAGMFAFGNLNPGTYTVLVAALGYESLSHPVEVRAGEVSDVALGLTPRALEGVPYTRTFGPITGKFFCGFGTGAISGPCKVIGFTDPSHPAETTWGQMSGGENNIFEFYNIIAGNKTLPSDQLKTLVVEISWMPTSAGSQWLQASVEDTAKDEDGEPSGRNLSEPTYAHSAGEGPLKMVVTPGEKHERGEIAMPVDWPGFTIGVFPTVDPASPAVTNPVNGRPVLVGASAYTEQTFQIWITMFYNAPGPADYTVLE